MENILKTSYLAVKTVCTSNYMVWRAIMDQLPKENVNSLVIARAVSSSIQLLVNYMLL